VAVHACMHAQEYVENILMLDMHRRDGIGKLAAVLTLRVQVGEGRLLVEGHRWLPTACRCIE
jgi:hypothetical protein